MADRHISLDRVLTSAWKSMVRILFKPFSLERWLALGLCSWMLTLGGEAGGNFGNFFPRPAPPNTSGKTAAQSWERLDHVLNGTDAPFLRRLAAELGIQDSTLYLWIVGIAGFLILVLVLIVLFSWLRSRFEFIFLDNLVHDRHEIKRPWREFKALGNSYFVGSLIFMLLLLAFNLLVAGTGAGIVCSWLSECAAARHLVGFGSSRILGTILLTGSWFLISCAVGLYIWFFFYLLVPIMYREQVGFKEGLRRMNGLFRHHFWNCVLFWLVMLIVQFGFGLAVLAVGLATCCLLFFLLSLPYIGAVVMLPYWTFLRMAGVELLEELDPRPQPPPEPEAAEPEEAAPSAY